MLDLEPFHVLKGELLGGFMTLNMFIKACFYQLVDLYYVSETLEVDAPPHHTHSLRQAFGYLEKNMRSITLMAFSRRFYPDLTYNNDICKKKNVIIKG